MVQYLMRPLASRKGCREDRLRPASGSRREPRGAVRTKRPRGNFDPIARGDPLRAGSVVSACDTLSHPHMLDSAHPDCGANHCSPSDSSCFRALQARSSGLPNDSRYLSFVRAAAIAAAGCAGVIASTVVASGLVERAFGGSSQLAIAGSAISRAVAIGALGGVALVSIDWLLLLATDGQRRAEYGTRSPRGSERGGFEPRNPTPTFVSRL